MRSEGSGDFAPRSGYGGAAPDPGAADQLACSHHGGCNRDTEGQRGSRERGSEQLRTRRAG